MVAAHFEHSSRCACGAVRLAATGRPIIASVCYCDDCQAAAKQIAANSAAPSSVADPDGGTEYLLFRKDRFACRKGFEHLAAVKLKDSSATRRMVATCCNSAMYMAFDDKRHWVSAFRNRFEGDVPPLEARICTKSRRSNDPIDTSVPSYAGYPPKLIFRLVGSMLAMTVASKRQTNPI
jgi:hypothetical protein